MDYKTLSDQIKKEEFKRVYLFYGPERYMLQIYENRLVRNALKGSESLWNFSRFGSNANPGAVYDACQQLPMGSLYRIVRVENCPAFEKAEPDSAWTNVIESVPDTCILLFIQGEKIDGRLALTKAVGADRQVFFDTLNEEDLCQIIAASTSARGLFYRKDALHRLIYQAGSDAATLMQETKKLESYIHPRTEITIEDVKSVSILNETTNAFEITDDLIEGNWKNAFDRLSLYIQQGGIILMLRGAIAYRLRELMTARRLLDQKKLPSAVMQSLKGPRIAREKTVQAAKRVSFRWIERALCTLAEGDELNKSGQINDERQALELSLIRAFIQNGKDDENSPKNTAKSLA